MTPLCMANGLYKITARQLTTPYRSGQIQFTTPNGCETFALSDGMFLTGSPAEAAAAGVSSYFAVGLDETKQYGAMYSSTCNPQIDVTSALPGWAGCVANGGTRVYAVFAGGGVFHASDVSWRVASASGDPTYMSGSGYSSGVNSQPAQWCMQSSAGPFTFWAYDNNVASSGNSSQGWDGGVVYITDPAGCIIFEGTVEATPANGGATINSWSGVFNVPPEGGCVQQDDRGSLLVGADANGTLLTGAAAPLDMGTCPYSYGALVSCTQSPPDPTVGAFNVLIPNAYTSTCAAMCASQNCMELAMSVAGPVPPGVGCCNQVSGQAAFNFSVWTFNPVSVDYGLIPNPVIADGNSQFRYLANNNRVLLGVLVQQTRWATGACTNTRFAKLNDVCQLTSYSSAPYGVDPAFVASSSLYQAGINMSAYYQPQEVSPYGIPYGFFEDAPGKAKFSVFFDINLKEATATNLLQYLQDGYYIDGLVRYV